MKCCNYLSSEYIINFKISLGTVSCILEGRPSDSTDKNYTDMFVKTFHFLGEPLAGTWTLRVFTEKVLRRFHSHIFIFKKFKFYFEICNDKHNLNKNI